MLEIKSATDFELVRETVDLECKRGAGPDGQGAVPMDLWPTYSAFANTQGGIIALGVRQKQDQFFVEGIQTLRKCEESFSTQ